MAFDWEYQWVKLQFNYKRQSELLQDLLVLIEDGVTTTQSLLTIKEISSGVLERICGSMLNAIGQGKNLAQSMEPWFVRPVIEVIQAGEASGRLLESLRAAEKMIRQRSSSIASVLTSILYPLTVLLAALGMAVFVKTTVFINFVSIKPVAAWPSIGQDLYGLANFIQYWWWSVLIFLLLLSVGLVAMFHYWVGDARKIIDRIPLLSLYRYSAAARFMEMLGLMLSNGITLKKALGVLQQDASPYLNQHILLMEYRLAIGQADIASVIDTQLVSHHDMVRLRVIAKGKGFEHALVSLGKQASKRNAKTMELFGKVLGGLLLLLGASIAALMVFGIYTVGSVIAT